GPEYIFMLDLNAMLLNRLDNQSADIFLGIRFDFETLDVINGFAQLFQELFFVPVGSRMDKEDNACVLAHPLAVPHELGKLSLTEVSRDTADIHADNIAVFVCIHSGGVDCGECLLELLKRAIKGDFDIVIET